MKVNETEFKFKEMELRIQREPKELAFEERELELNLQRQKKERNRVRNMFPTREQQEHEFKMKELELARKSSSITQLSSDIEVDSFDAAKNIRFVNCFQEIPFAHLTPNSRSIFRAGVSLNILSFIPFLHFEKITVSL